MKKFIGIDLGGTNINAGLFTDDGKIYNTVHIPSYGNRGKEAVFKQLRKSVDILDDGSIQQVGIGTPGTVDSFTGSTLNLGGNIKDWSNTGISKQMQIYFPEKQFHILNDANAAALGEYWRGVGKDYSSFVMLTLGTGLGGAYVDHSGELLNGAHFQATELGHVVIEPDGRPCSCGKNGCIERYVSGSGLELNYFEKTGKRLNGEAIISSIEKDCNAFDAIGQFVNYLGLYLINLQNIFDPEAIILGGGMIDSREIWWDLLLKQIDVYNPQGLPVKIIAGSLGNDAGMIGAAKFAWDRAAKEEKHD